MNINNKINKINILLKQGNLSFDEINLNHSPERQLLRKDTSVQLFNTDVPIETVEENDPYATKVERMKYYNDLATINGKLKHFQQSHTKSLLQFQT